VLCAESWFTKVKLKVKPAGVLRLGNGALRVPSGFCGALGNLRANPARRAAQKDTHACIVSSLRCVLSSVTVIRDFLVLGFVVYLHSPPKMEHDNVWEGLNFTTIVGNVFRESLGR
jgi:hypothetical protein